MVNPASVVLVHGAWFDRSCWDAVIAELGKLGTQAVAVELPLTGFDADVAVVRQAIAAAGPRAVVAAHSYGGAELAARLRSMPLNGADMTYEGEPAWKSTSSTYVLCTEDRAIPPAAQQWMAARADEVVEWPTDHSPFLTRPRELAVLLVSDRG